MNKIKTILFEQKNKQLWDHFITNSKNGNFLLKRNYMEYHSERFNDYSLMFYEKDNLVAVMPANIKDKTLLSHEGLTYGGIISNEKMNVLRMMNIFESMKEHLSNIGVNKIIYKPIPHIYHQIPAEEDLYLLFINKSKLLSRNISTTISMDRRGIMTHGRRECIKKSKINGIEIKRSYDVKTFMDIVTVRLNEKYGVKPTHTKEEIELLINRFPNNIKLFSAYKKDEMLAGVIIYESDTVAHAQYIESNDKGRALHATDLIIDFLINRYYSEKRYFDFGISTEKNGYYLNEGLITYKESFGASATVYDHYSIDI